jgi:hypothetical protein
MRTGTARESSGAGMGMEVPYPPATPSRVRRWHGTRVPILLSSPEVGTPLLSHLLGHDHSPVGEDSRADSVATNTATITALKTTTTATLTPPAATIVAHRRHHRSRARVLAPVRRLSVSRRTDGPGGHPSRQTGRAVRAFSWTQLIGRAITTMLEL